MSGNSRRFGCSAELIPAFPNPDEVFIALIDVLSAATGALIDRIDDDVKNGFPQQGGPFRFDNQHCEFQEGSEVEYP